MVNLSTRHDPAPVAGTRRQRRQRREEEEDLDAFRAREAAEYQKAFLETAKERIKLTHEIAQRSSNELRDEERTSSTASSSMGMLTAGVPMPDDRTRHVVAELVNSIFNVDKMLYFVAPSGGGPGSAAAASNSNRADPGGTD